MMFALGVAVGCAVAVMLIFTLANITRQKPTSFMLQDHNDTLSMLNMANILRERQAAALESIEALLASHNRQITPCPSCGQPWDMSKAFSCQCGAVLKQTGTA